jgi:hypothetical protein
MKKISILFCLATSLGSAHAAILDFDFLNGQMDGLQEVPLVATSATGLRTSITYDDSSNLFSVSATFSGLSSAANDAHVHGPAAVGVDGGVFFGLGFTAATSGTISGSQTLTETQEADLFNQLFYVNLHSGNHPGGEIRGQLVPVPEPREYVLLAGIGALAFAVWRRLQRRNRNPIPA